MSGGSLFVSLMLGAVGLGYFTYGRRQQVVWPLVSGVGLMVFPYFVDSILWMLAIGAALMALPFFMRE